MKIEDFQKHSHELVDWMFKYLKEIEKYPIKPNIEPERYINHYHQIPQKVESLLKRFLMTLIEKLSLE